MARRLGVAREDVITAAVDVLDTVGLDGMTVAAVAARVGCRPPSVYHHVDGLDGLQREVTLVSARDCARVLTQAADGHRGVDALREMATALHDWAMAHPGRFAATCRPTDPEDTDLVAARGDVVLPVQDALIEAGVPAPRRGALLAAVLAVARGTIEAALLGNDAEDGSVAEGRDLLVGLLLDRVQAEAVSSPDPADRSALAT